MALRKQILASLLIGSVALTCIDTGETDAQTTSRSGYSRTTQCFKDEYQEEYVPGTKKNPGYVRQWTEKVEIECADLPAATSSPENNEPKTDSNSCIEGSVIGGLLGAGAGAALSRGSGRWVGVPVGAAAGAMVGCQVDGG